MSKGYRCDDHRKVNARGQRIRPVVPEGLRRVEYGHILRGALDAAFKYFRAQITHLPEADILWPKAGELPGVLHGFVVSTQQLYAAMCKLLEDKAPQQLVMPAGIVSRALLEGLGNLFAILEDPSGAISVFRRADFRDEEKQTRYIRRRFGEAAIGEERRRRRAEYAAALKLTPGEIEDLIRPEHGWPTPGRLIQAPLHKTPHISGERRRVFEELYDYWYGALSSLAHHQLSALQMAHYAEEQPDEGKFLLTKSATIGFALSVVLCMLSEIEAHLDLAPCQPLRAAWSEIADLHKITQAVFEMRYRRLLGMPESTGSPTGG